MIVSNAADQNRKVMPMTFESNVAEGFYNNLMLDLWPSTPAQMVDFGFNHADDQQRLYVAFQHGVRSGKVSAEELDKAVGKGKELTALVQRFDPSLIVKTDYDALDGWTDEFDDE